MAKKNNTDSDRTASDEALSCFLCHLAFCEFQHWLGPSINGLVTGRNAKICCHGFVIALFQGTTAIKIDSEW